MHTNKIKLIGSFYIITLNINKQSILLYSMDKETTTVDVDRIIQRLISDKNGKDIKFS